MTGFASTTAQDAACRSTEENQWLSVHDGEVFVEALLSPPPVNDRLRDTVRRYRQATGV
jgi:uncharacterized protein (DUF1778 family)